MKIIDFNNCLESIKNGSYGGAGRKDGVIYNDEMWILKYPKITKDMRGDHLLSYTQSPLSEYIGSHIYEILGFETHETVLGIKNDKLVVGCKDFCKKGEHLLEARTIINYANGDLASEMDSPDSPSSSFDQNDIDMIMLQLEKNPILSISGMKERFWDQVIVDAYINNNDRNYGNWGIIRDENGYDRIAPVYDNGAAFNNKLNDSALKHQLEDKDFESRAINVMSVYFRDGKRLYLNSLFKIENPVFEKEIHHLVPVIEKNHDRVCDMIQSLPEKINDIPIISPEKKEHCVRGLTARLENVLIGRFGIA